MYTKTICKNPFVFIGSFNCNILFTVGVTNLFQINVGFTNNIDDVKPNYLQFTISFDVLIVIYKCKTF